MTHLPFDPAAPGDPYSILVVEDDGPTVRLLELLLTRHGYRVITADSLAAARAALQAGCLDLVLLDRGLPDGDGAELAREVRADASSGCYVLMVSGHVSERSKIEGLDGGADDYVTKPFMTDELLARIRAGLRVVALQKELVATNRRLETLATTDSLTEVYNRRWFDEQLERSFEQALRYGRPLSLAMIDIDRFKSINDTWGHVAGDAVLREISRRIVSVLRRSDVIARVGGEEFAILLPETALFEGLQAAEKIRSAIGEEPMDAGYDQIRVTVSAGVASIPHSRLTRPAQLVWCADQALYRAKNRGRDRVELERRAEPWRPTRGAPVPRDDREIDRRPAP